MSFTILQYARKFLDHGVKVETFSHSYIVLWKIERDAGLLAKNYHHKDDRNLDECLSCIFTAADAFEPQDDRRDCELDEGQFREEVAQHVAKYDASNGG